mmetsp:Transcript_26616/g.53480  ORF Transcript_26616/g.53480 Transcript_26616/m.53480 type:complete len:100 (-) Transcript_26616:147-446(-)
MPMPINYLERLLPSLCMPPLELTEVELLQPQAAEPHAGGRQQQARHQRQQGNCETGDRDGSDDRQLRSRERVEAAQRTSRLLLRQLLTTAVASGGGQFN